MLIYSAHITGSPIIVSNHIRAEQILRQAKELGCNVTVFTVNEYTTYHRNCDGVLIDEALDIIELALQNYLGSKVIAVTCTIPITDLASNKNESEVGENNG